VPKALPDALQGILAHNTIKNMKTLTRNAVANWIESKGVTKWMSGDAARAVWNDLRRDGWRAEGLTLVKVEGGKENRFHFAKQGSRVTIRHDAMEVAQ
jgi:hypothetical protein